MLHFCIKSSKIFSQVSRHSLAFFSFKAASLKPSYLFLLFLRARYYPSQEGAGWRAVTVSAARQVSQGKGWLQTQQQKKVQMWIRGSIQLLFAQAANTIAGDANFLIRDKENFVIATKVGKWVDDNFIFTHKIDEEDRKSIRCFGLLH